MQGGMMEEWHQKLHNNTSPDDVVICQALLSYIDSGLDISVYWATLKVLAAATPFLLLNVQRISPAKSFWPHSRTQQECNGLLSFKFS